jgi:hypothetical protein
MDFFSTGVCPSSNLLAFSLKGLFETYYVELNPGTALEAEPRLGNAAAHVVIFQGALEILVGEQQFTARRVCLGSWRYGQRPHLKDLQATEIIGYAQI